MTWSSPTEFLAMGGYGAYVWGAMGMSIIAVCAEQMLLGLRRRSALLQAVREQRMQKKAVQ